MCTATWVRSEGGGYELLFNRDELKSRSEADPPRRHEREGVAWVAPVDRDAGGSWIATNEHGLSVALLNGYRVEDDRPPAELTSRGLLVADLATARDRGEAVRRLSGLDPSPFRSFRLLVLAPDAPALVAEYDLRRLEIDPEAEHRLPLISSSFEETEVGRARRAEYERVTGCPAGRGVLAVAGSPEGPEGAASAGPDLDRLLAFHRSARGGPSAFTVSMERPEAATRSFTRVTVTPAGITMRYTPGPPHAQGPETRLHLPRAPLSSRLPPEEQP
jgi:hypothetical protein